MSSQTLRPHAELVRDVQAALRGLHHAVDSLSQTVADQLGVNRTDLRCIHMLGLHGPLTAGQLAEMCGLTTGAVTAVIDRLESIGFARRVRDLADRRRVYVELTPSAGQQMGAIYRDLIAASTATMENYSDEMLIFLRDFVQRGSHVTLEHVERVKAMNIAVGDKARQAEPS
ncbi:MAG: MarR family transcriptional regulator [Thermomicrobiales bacterium]